MQLYAKITNEDGKTAGKGGNDELRISIMRGNNEVLGVQVLNSIITIHNPDKMVVITTRGQKIEGKKRKDDAICADRHCINPEHKHSWMRK